MMEHLEVMVEEASMEAALEALLPRILHDTPFRIHVHQGKKDLLQRLPERLSGYRRWLPPGWQILVIVDRDDEDCVELKQELERIAVQAGFGSRGRSRMSVVRVMNRIAIEELEAWYFGDWEAVRAAYPRVSVNIPSQAGYREPDAIQGGTWEAFERVLQGAGYFKGGLRKIEAARLIAAHMKPERSSSRSFQALREALSTSRGA